MRPKLRRAPSPNQKKSSPGTSPSPSPRPALPTYLPNPIPPPKQEHLRLRPLHRVDIRLRLRIPRLARRPDGASAGSLVPQNRHQTHHRNLRPLQDHAGARLQEHFVLEAEPLRQKCEQDDDRGVCDELSRVVEGEVLFECAGDYG